MSLSPDPIWREVDQLAIYKHDRKVGLQSNDKQLQLSVVRAELEPVTSGFQVGGPNPSSAAAALPT